MSENQAPATKPDNKPVLDLWLQRSAWGAATFAGIVAGILGVLALLTNYIIPNWALFFVLPNAASLAVSFYLWRKKKNIANGIWTQQVCLVNIVVSVNIAITHFGKRDGYNIFIGCEWVVAAMGWVAYSWIASYEEFKYSNEIVDILRSLTESDKGQIDNIKGLSEIQNLNRQAMELFTLVEIAKVAEKIAAKLNMPKSELLDSKLPQPGVESPQRDTPPGMPG